MGPGNEIVTVVDAANQPVGTASRRRMRAERLIHRATYILVFDSGGRLLVQRRTADKDLYPGYYDVAAGGVVLAGESYEEAAVREAEEELGIEATPLEGRFDFYFEDGSTRVWGRVFSCVHDGPFALQAEEIESAEFMGLDDVLSEKVRPLTPDGLLALRRYLEQQGLQRRATRET